MKKLIIFAAVSILFLNVNYVEAQTGEFFCFTKQLKSGSVGNDVKILQQTLNQNADTKLVNSGPGSFGNETSYFGPLTQAALIRFQNKYKGEMTTPPSLGIFDLSTLLKMNKISNCGHLSQITPTSTASTTQVTASSTPALPGIAGSRIFSVSSTTSKIGGIITLTGEFATTGNSINFGKYRVASNVNSENDTLKFMIPVDSRENCTIDPRCTSFYYKVFEPGTYGVSVTNTNGKSNPVSIEIAGSGVNDDLVIFDPSTQIGPTWIFDKDVPPWNIQWRGENNLNVSTSTFDILMFREQAGCIVDPCPTYLIPTIQKVKIGHIGSTYIEWTEGKKQRPAILQQDGNYRIQVCIQDTNTCGLSSTIWYRL